MNLVNVHDAKTNFSALLERAHRGEEIILAKAGRPYARLVSLEAAENRVPGRYRDDIPPSFWDELPAEELGPWES